MAEPDVSIVHATDATTVLTPSTKNNKVKVACQRCRDKRTKCDRQRPSCSKCTKAGTTCIDVDIHGTGGVPRAFIQDTQARLRWLESLVKTRLPDVDLDAGPGSLVVPDHAANDQPESPSGHGATLLNTPAGADRGARRSWDQTRNDEILSVPKRARRMAADLGVFSVNPNGMQTQYLGSSSGSFFAGLLAASSPANVSESDSDDVEDAVDQVNSVRYGGRSLASLKDALPPREDCDRMVKKFFSFYHADYPFLHQPSVFNLVDALYASTLVPSDCQVQQNGWPATVKAFPYNGEMACASGGQQDAIAIHVETGITHLFFVLSIAAELQSRKRRSAINPKPFFTQAMRSLQYSVGEVSLSSIQSLVLYVLHGFLSAGCASIWVVMHIATSYAIDIGLQRIHSENVALHSPTLLQIRRRVFLTVYTLERYISTIQGRPLGFEDHSLDLAMPIQSTEPFDSESVRSDQLSLSCSIAHFQWASMISKIKQRFYRLKPGNRPDTDINEMQRDLQEQLDRWLGQSMLVVDTLPSTQRARFMTKIKIDYHFGVGLLHQPSQSCPRPDDRALEICFKSARLRIRLSDALYRQNNLVLHWPCTHGIFLAGAAYVYSIWASSDLRSRVSPAEVAVDFRLCSSLLALGGEWWPIAHKGKRSFDRLADATLNALMSRGTGLGPGMMGEGGGGPRIETSRAAGSGQYDHLALAPDPTGMPNEDYLWLGVEDLLQPYLQNDFQFPDLFGSFDVTDFDTPESQFDGLNGFYPNVGL